MASEVFLSNYYSMASAKNNPFTQRRSSLFLKDSIDFFFPLLPTGTKLKHCSYSILLIPQL